MKLQKICLTLFLGSISLCGSAQNSSIWNAPASASLIKNPIASTETSLADGKAIYISTCAPCHGNKGKGDGIASVACNPKPADHTSRQVQNETDGAIFWKITNGHGQMISYKSILDDSQRWKLVLYIRTLSSKK